MLKSLIAAAVIVVLLLAGRAVLDSPPAPEVSRPAGPAEQAESDSAPALQLPPTDAALDAVVSPSRAALTPDSADAAPEPKTATFKGAVIIHDVEGNVLSTSANGTLTASLSYDRTGTKVEIDVSSGAFALAFEQGADGIWIHPGETAKGMKFTAGAKPEDLELEVNGGEFEVLGDLVVMESPSSTAAVREWQVPLDQGGTELHLRTIPPFTLNVVDAKNPSVLLADVEVLAARGQTDSFPLGGGRSRTALASAQASPLTLTPSAKQAREKEVLCFVRAPGFAWNAVPLNLSSGGERTVALETGGDLMVQIQGEVPSKARLRIYPDGARSPLSDLPIKKDEELVLEGLGLGNVTARIEIGLYFRRPIVLAEEQVLIQPRSRASVLLIPSEVEVAEPVEVSGEFVLPREWQLEDAVVTVGRSSPSTGGKHENSRFFLRQLSAETSRPDVYPFSLGLLVPGTYVATLSGLRLSWEIEVPTTELTDLRLEVPPPVNVTVTVRDSITGEVSDLIESVHWEPKFDGRRNSSRYAQVSRNETTKRFDLRVPAGPVIVGASHRQIQRSAQTIEATDGLEVELEVRRIPLARMEFQHEGRRIPWPEDFNFDRACRPMDGEGEIVRRGSTKTGVTFSVSEPGRYRVTLPKLEGFAPHEPIEIDMTPEEIQNVIIELTES